MATKKSKKKSAKKSTKKTAKKKATRTTAAVGLDENNRMHERLFLVLSYQNQLSLSANFVESGKRKLSGLPYWQSVAGAGLQQQAAITYAGRLVLKMVEWFKLVPKAGTSDPNWSAAYKAIETLIKDATKHTVAALGSAFSDNYVREES